MPPLKLLRDGFFGKRSVTVENDLDPLALCPTNTAAVTLLDHGPSDLVRFGLALSLAKELDPADACEMQRRIRTALSRPEDGIGGSRRMMRRGRTEGAADRRIALDVAALEPAVSREKTRDIVRRRKRREAGDEDRCCRSGRRGSRRVRVPLKGRRGKREDSQNTRKKENAN